MAIKGTMSCELDQSLKDIRSVKVVATLASDKAEGESRRAAITKARQMAKEF